MRSMVMRSGSRSRATSTASRARPASSTRKSSSSSWSRSTPRMSASSSTTRMRGPSPPAVSPSPGGSSPAATGRGRVTVKVAPWPTRLSTPMAPPCSSTMPRQMASPRPVPPTERTLLPSSCWNFLKSLPMSSGAMPRPRSVTRSSSCAPARRVVTCTVDPAGENLMAFESRFVTTCTMRSPSTRTWGRPRSTSDSMTMLRLSAKAAIPSTATETNSSTECTPSSSWMCPASIFEMSRILVMSRMRRSVFFTEMSTSCRWVASSWRPGSDRSRWSDPLIEVSGVRSSWETVETNSVFMRSISRWRVTSLKVMVAPTVAPRRSRMGAARQPRVRASGVRSSRSPADAAGVGRARAATRARAPG